MLLSGATRVVVSGTDAAAFSVVAQPPSLVVTGDSASFTVNFTASTEGSRTAMLSIANNDSNENPYRINLTATVLSRIAGWRQTHFGSPASTGMAADGADFDQDGIPNLVEYALGLHPGQNSAGQLPAAATSGGQFGMTFAEPAGMSGIVYGAEWSDSLAPGSWQPATDSGTPPQHVFSVPVGTSTRLFMRLKVLSTP